MIDAILGVKGSVKGMDRKDLNKFARKYVKTKNRVGFVTVVISSLNNI